MNDLKEMSDERIAEQAAEWFSRLREGDLADAESKRFAHWLAASPIHIREYLSLAETWGTLHGVQGWPDQSAEELLQAMRATQPATVVALPRAVLDSEKPQQCASAMPNSSTPPRSHHRGLPSSKLAVAAAMALLTLTAAWFWLASDENEYRTARGEQRSVVLSDGSVIQLNTLTRMVVRFDEGRRRIELPQGEAFFRVARDPNRPFEVKTPFARVRVVGTEFNVYNRPDSTRVAVVEGRVQVASSQSSVTKPLALGAQQSVNVGAGGKIAAVIHPRTALATESDTAWIQRRIVLDNTPLDAAVAEFNRYNNQQMQLADAHLAALRISGVFSADDPGALMKYLEEVQDVEIRPDESGFVLQRNH